MKTLHDKNYEQLFGEKSMRTKLGRTNTACDECGTELVFNNIFSFHFKKGNISTTDVECPSCGFKGELIV